MTKPAKLNISSRGFAVRTGTGLYAHVVDTVGQAIVDGTLPVDQIIQTDQLCEQLEVSRSVVREGLRALGAMGLIEARPQLGTRVLSAENWDLLNPQVVSWRARSTQRNEQMLQLQEFRLGIEPTAASLAAQRCQPEEVDDLVQAAQAMQQAMETADLHGFFAADAEFHRILLQGSGNPVIAQFSDTVQASLHSRSQEGRPVSEVLSPRSVQRHIDLARAIQNRDAKAAKELAYLINEATLAEFQPE